MKENRFFTLMLVLGTGVLFLLSAVNFLSAAESERYRVSVIVSDSSAGRWFSFREGLQQAAKDNNIELSFLTTDRFGSLSQEGNLITREIQNGADGIIVSFRSSLGTMEMVTSYTGRTTLELVDTEVERDGTGRDIGSVLPDNEGMGRALASLVLADSPQGEKLRIGLLDGNPQQRSIQERLSAFQEEIRDKNVEISWEIYGEDKREEKLSQKMAVFPVDILLSLDNAGLEDALKFVQEESLEGMRLYGVGNSDALVYALGNGELQGLVVPEEYNMGYYALTDLAATLNHRLLVPEKRQIGYRVITRDNMYDDENQRILFPKIE